MISKVGKAIRDTARAIGGGYNLLDYSLDDLYRSASSGGGVGAYRPDVSGAINSYRQQADANKANAANVYNTTRNDLLTSLKRFQENNAKQVSNQKQSYLSDQSAMDMAKEQANRQSRIGTAARGLGGSGLQRLAEVQNDLGLQGDESQLANKNQSILDALKSALVQETEDTNNKINTAKTNYNNQIRSIDANLAQQIAAINYQADQQYAQSLAQARAYGSASRANANNAYNVLVGNTRALEDALKNQNRSQLKSTYGASSNKALGSTIANYYGNLFANTSGMSGAQYDRAMNNVDTLLKYYGLI